MKSDMEQISNLSGYVNIVGAGISGLSAAITLASSGIRCNLISSMPSERAQSVLAEGGINAALDNMGEGDSPEEHFADTMRGGCYLETESCIHGLTKGAPDIINELARFGVPFTREDNKIIQRPFGGQKKRRTCYSKSSTGKMIMTALIDVVRKYESEGLVVRYPDHVLTGADIKEGILNFVTVKSRMTGDVTVLPGPAVICCGGLNGFFEGFTTGTTQNTGDCAAILFNEGVEFANLEFIQYHPTTVAIADKRMLISEAARGEGGRLYIERGGEPWYFMEEKYPESGNLMPRDVVSREMFKVMRDPSLGGTVYLDMREISKSCWKNKLSDLREEIRSYLLVDPAVTPVPVAPGIHFFMGGIRVDDGHRTNIKGLYAAGECASKYHGANRLGGNSMLAAVYGGKTAAESVIKDAGVLSGILNIQEIGKADHSEPVYDADTILSGAVRNILIRGLGIIRDEDSITSAIDELGKLYKEGMHDIDLKRIKLAEAMLMCARERKESRGAHVRSDYPDTLDDYKKTTCCSMNNGKIIITMQDPLKERR